MRTASLCTGYGGLELAGEALGLEPPNWVSEIDPDASRILEARWPQVPNVGDFRTANPPPVDILTAGFPCQPMSQAGKQKGNTDDRWIWPDIAALVGRMEPRPRLLLLENVPRLLTVNDGDAMAEIVSSLHRLGYVGTYRLLRASDVGACHQRRRWFCIAAHTDGPGQRPDPRGKPGEQAVAGSFRRLDPNPDHQPGGPGESKLLPTPQASDGTRGPDYARARFRRSTHGSGGDDLTTTVAKLLPTPTASNGKDWTDDSATIESLGRARGDGGAGSLVDLPRLLPTPVAADSRNSRNETADPTGQRPGNGRTMSDVANRERWGDYIDAIHRHWNTVGRPPPSPDVQHRRLNPAFVEWMMMLPEGWVTDPALELTRTAQLRILGNGAVPRQAAAAYTELLTRMEHL